jgi:hypothetical protein
MKLNNILYGVIGAVALSACSEEMNYHENDDYDKEFVTLNFNNVGGLMTGIYSDLDYDFGNYSGALLASATDEAEYAYTGNQIEDFYNGAWSPTNAKSSMWTTCYRGIANCNLYLKDFLGLTFPELVLNSDYDKQMYRYENYQYEVRFLRAYFYFNLVRQYGDVPFTDKLLTAEETNQLERTPAQDVFNFIIAECDAIKDEIIEDYTNLGDMALPSTETARPNRMAVLALKARTALYAAGKLFNPTEDLSLWHRAATAQKELIDACEAKGMKLTANYESLWAADNWSNAGTLGEIIFARRVGDSNTMETNNFPIGLEGAKGGNCPTQTLVDAYEMKATGLRWDEEGSGYVAGDPYGGRDPRLAMTIAKNGDEKWPNWNATPLETFQGGLNGEPLTGATPTGYYLKKYLQTATDLRSGQTTKFKHTWITFRLGEFYLNYAEAVFRYLGDPYRTDGEFTLSAAAAVNKTRTRAGMPDVPEGLSNDVFWEKYKNERMVELAFEGHRFWDVRRWKEADKYFKSIDEMKIYKGTTGYTYIRKTVNRLWDDKMYLFPIPQTERMKNPKLSQNPGW